VIGLLLYLIHRKLEQIHAGSPAKAHERADEAMAEAKSAHNRVDRIDDEMRGDRHALGVMRAMADVIKGRLTFLMHKDLSNEIAEQAKRDGVEQAKRDGAANADKIDP
jgi:hypothetical protein